MIQKPALGEPQSHSELIRHTQGVLGGDACVRNTRIPVWTLVQLKQLGRTDGQLTADFPGLTQAPRRANSQSARRHP